ncbi:unnamed protein product [Allacma fusca]|uniref:Kinesin motor domain-containing protein n=1 Tax=Allacma fusca TaxID=39272 RepID=A0A8J2K856_9HEXA|nr:unnamed protein product [Allacma fusca]
MKFCSFFSDGEQSEICAASGAELVASVLGGEDGCFVSLGYCTQGKKQTMFGRPANLKMGVVPTTVSWLFKCIHEQKQKTGSRFSVRVSAVEVTGGSGHEVIHDLLLPFAKGTSSFQLFLMKFISQGRLRQKKQFRLYGYKQRDPRIN